MKKFDFDFFKIILSGIIFVISLFIDTETTKFILLIISYIIVSYEMYISAFKNILKGEIFDENLLMIVATIGAFFIGEYEEALMVMLLFNLGEYLSDKAVDNSSESILKLMDLRSDRINLKLNGKIYLDMIQENLKGFYTEFKDEIKLLNGYIVCAIDGSDFEIPNTIKTRNKYNILHPKECVARASVSNMFDILNYFVMDTIIEKYDSSERKMTKQNLKNVKALDLPYPIIRVMMK